MTTTKDIFALLDKKAPTAMKMEFDNVGHLIGRSDRTISRILIALDITDEVIEEAITWNAELIVAHHPVIFQPLSQIIDSDLAQRRILKLIRHDIAAICMHTNLDCAPGGVNDALAAAVGLVSTEILSPLGEIAGASYGLGRIGNLAKPQSMAQFLQTALRSLDTRGIRYHDAGRPVSRVAVMGGSGGGELFRAAELGADTYLVGECKYNTFLDARELGVNLVEADHYCTEQIVCPCLKAWICKVFLDLDVRISTRHSQTARFYTEK